MSSSQRSSHSPSWTTARLPRKTRSPSTSQHQVTPPTRVLTPSTHSRPQVNSTRITSPRHNLFSSNNHHDIDDDSIQSTDSNHPDMMLITPCDNFPKYGVWLKQMFPDIITATGGFFVHSQLKIRSQEDIDDFLEFSPEDWKNHLPRSYHIWRKTIIELIIIWTVTSYMKGCITYARYMEIREEMLPTLNEIYGETEASKIYSSNNDVPNLVESPQSPPTPPPYQKVSPSVIQWQSKCMKNSDTPGSNRSYRTIPPAFIDPDTHEELDKFTKSIHNASNRSNRSPHHSQPPTYKPKIVNMHKRPPKFEFHKTKTRDAMDIDGYGGDGGDGGIYAFNELKFLLLQES